MRDRPRYAELHRGVLAGVRLTVLGLVLALSNASASTLLEQGFEAAYAASYKGLSVGVTRRRLTRLDEDRWSFTSENEPQGLVKLIVGFEITERSELLLQPETTRPLHYAYRFGERSDKSYRLAFDWADGKLHAQPADVHLDLPPGTQDNLSFLIAVMQRLQLGATRFDMVVAGRNKLRAHDVRVMDEQRVHTPMGEFATVFVQAQEVGKDTRYELWCAPEFDYLPVKMRQIKKGESDIELELGALQRLDGPAP